MLRKITTIIILTLLIIGAGFYFCAHTKHHKTSTTQTTQTTQSMLTVNLQPPVLYVNKQGKSFEAIYGSLSDNSLQFVKITTPDGKKYTLPQVLSGSGARYTDDREIVWWEHHGVIRLDIRDEKGRWKEGYEELTKQDKKSLSKLTS